jgi:hypothetical protein
MRLPTRVLQKLARGAGRREHAHSASPWSRQKGRRACHPNGRRPVESTGASVSRVNDGPYRLPPPKPPDPYRGAWARLRRSRLISAAGGLLTVSFIAATSLSPVLWWIPLAIVAFLVLWMPAFRGLDSRCPHCQQLFFGEAPASPRGTLPYTLWTFFSVRRCRRCRIPLGTPKDAAASFKPLPPGVRQPGEWRCACGEINQVRRTTCGRCWAQRPAA